MNGCKAVKILNRVVRIRLSSQNEVAFDHIETSRSEIVHLTLRAKRQAACGGDIRMLYQVSVDTGRSRRPPR